MWNRSIFWVWSSRFPRSVETEYIKLRSVFRHGWNANISCPWNQIISLPAEPKREIFFLPFSPTGTQVPAWSDERERCTDPNACSTRVSAESLGRIYRLLKTFSGFNSLSQLSPKSLPKQSQWKQHICGVIAVLLATFLHTQTTEPVNCQWKRQISPFLKYTVIEASYQQQAYKRWSLGESPVFVWSVLPDLKALWFYFPVTWRPPLAFISTTTATRCRCPTRKCKNES